MRLMLGRIQPLFNSDGGSGGGTGGGLAGAAAAAAANGGAGDGAGNAGATGGNASGNAGEGQGWKAPDGIPQEFLGSNADETLSKLLGGFTDVNTRFTGLREKLSKMPAAPEKPELYQFDPPDNLKPYFGDLSKLPAYETARQAAHKYGMTNEQFAGFISDTYGPLAEQGLLIEPFNPSHELKTFETVTGLDRKATAETLAANEVFANGLAEQLKVPDAVKNDVKAALLGLTDTAVGNVLLQALSGRMNDVGIRMAGDGGQQGMLTPDDLKKLDADPRIDPRNRENPDPAKRFDAALRERYDAAYRQHFPSR